MNIIINHWFELLIIVNMIMWHPVKGLTLVNLVTLAPLVNDEFSCVHVLFKHSSCPLQLLFKRGVYFVQLAWRCGYSSRAATNRERRLIERIRYTYMLYHRHKCCIGFIWLSTHDIKNLFQWSHTSGTVVHAQYVPCEHAEQVAGVWATLASAAGQSRYADMKAKYQEKWTTTC